ncbi:unnamed protein product [Mytilus edulis]|uniref:B box-type domain-containing protein n=1 Tax=Mytilus edulis TaxID=6550 RepID=A0A8S3RJU6_MYTED|nr:unnamed protein product [Mytilus edulis]
MAFSESLNQAQVPFCSFCKLENITEWKCVDCDKQLCYECKRFHLWEFDWNSHNVVCTRPALAEGLSDLPELAKTCCTKHKEFGYTNYCLDCRQLMCPECIALGSIHFKHENITIVKCREKSLGDLEHLKTNIESRVLPNIEDKIKSLTGLDIAFEERHENEKKKIAKQAEKLKEQITQCTNMQLLYLEKFWKKNKDIIEKEKSQLIKIQKELKNEIKNIMSIRIKNIEEIVHETADISSRIQQNSNPPVSFPQDIIMFHPKTNTTTDISTIMGGFKNHNMASEVKGRIRSYRLIQQIKQNSSLAVARDETIYIADDDCVSIEQKPHKKTKITRVKHGILDIATLDLSNLLLISREDLHVLTKSESGGTKSFYTLRNSNNIALALCVCGDGRVLVLYAKEVPSSKRKSECQIKLKIDMLSHNGTLMKIIKFNYPSQWNTFSTSRFRMRQNINGHLCIFCEEHGEVADISQDGTVNWKYKNYLACDIETTPIGNIIVLERYSNELKILSSGGELLQAMQLDLSKPETNSICFKNGKEFVIISREEMFILELSFPI